MHLQYDIRYEHTLPYIAYFSLCLEQDTICSGLGLDFVSTSIWTWSWSQPRWSWLHPCFQERLRGSNNVVVKSHFSCMNWKRLYTVESVISNWKQKTNPKRTHIWHHYELFIWQSNPIRSEVWNFVFRDSSPSPTTARAFTVQHC